jgi:predicted DCC family thiol-disulfide oxidoreductase YuxK
MLKLEKFKSHYPIIVYYDGACKLCRSEMNNIAARDHASRLVLIDCNTPSFDYAALGIAKVAMLNEIHARKADGTWLRGVDVFIAMYHAVNLGWVARAMAHPRVKPLAMAFYPWFVRNRYWLSQLGLHKIMDVFAWRARTKMQADQTLKQQAERAFANSAACKSGVCLPSAKLSSNRVENQT